MSLTGSAQRLRKLTRGNWNAWVSAAGYSGVILLIVAVWAAVLVWYCIFGLWLVPYRLIRRGQRKRPHAGPAPPRDADDDAPEGPGAGAVALDLPVPGHRGSRRERQLARVSGLWICDLRSGLLSPG
jgi:hypothetical protein